MWETKKSRKTNSILCLEFNEFALVEVEKIKKDNLNFFSIEFDIYDIYNNNFVLYKMEDITNILNIFKKEVERLYNIIDDLSDNELDDYLDKLDDLLNDY